MTRIISGRAGGRRLQTPAGSGTRPTSDRVREALFSRLEHLDVLSGARVLDLYAGSGALGLEAASRGAGPVLLVESNRAAAKVARANASVTGLTNVQVRADTVERVLAAGPVPGEQVDLVFLDPPYGLAEEDLGGVLLLLVAHRWLAGDALVVVERSTRSHEPLWPPVLESAGERRQGESRMWFADFRGPEEVA
jgi:16S rRNA (guanine966-N2)-methyltransferase